MALDGITIAALTNELNQYLKEGRIYKIAQPEPDELMLTIKNNSTQYRLVLSANASLPLVYLTDDNKVSPVTAPSFCMLLRKHIQNGRILSITQPDFERIIIFKIEHLNELGDLCQKNLIIELMGKYSNIIFTNEENMILDSIKHISAMVSSVREVLPGKQYFIPSQEKANPLLTDAETFKGLVFSKNMPLFKALYSSFTGISPLIAHELCEQADVEGDMPACEDTNQMQEAITAAFENMIRQLQNCSFHSAIYYENEIPAEYACIPLTSYPLEQQKAFTSVSSMLREFYAQKEKTTRSRQKSADLRKIVTTILERDSKKYDLQLHQLQDTDKMEQYKIYGELLQTYGYGIEPGAKSAVLNNYYTGEDITVPLDPQKKPLENASRYFDKYGKCKRTKEALTELTIEVKKEMEHLESILTALDIADKEEDLSQIREEMVESGYIRRKNSKNRQRFTSRPFHYRSHDGFDIYVGKNNYQNEDLTFKVATGNDWWFHAKGIPGSHVIVKSEEKELPDRVFEEAGRLAAHYSKGKDQEKVEVDYTQKKNVKKTPGGNPGFVIYHTNYSLLISTDISDLELITD